MICVARFADDWLGNLDDQLTQVDRPEAFPAHAADKYAAAHHGRLRERKVRAGKSESPFQLETRHILRCELRHFRRLETPLRAINAPPVPTRYIRRVGKAGRGGCTDASRTWRSGSDFLSRDPV